MMAGVMEPTRVSASFDEFFVDEYRRLVALATALCGSRAIGEDVVQEAMFAASRQWEKISTYENPAQWARGVVARRSSNVRRGRFRESRAAYNSARSRVSAAAAQLPRARVSFDLSRVLRSSPRSFAKPRRRLGSSKCVSRRARRRSGRASVSAQPFSVR
jgi:DNA-directed RNA polymerase specialized sigma24 family protein